MVSELVGIEGLRNDWTEIPVGTRVQKIGRVGNELRSWFGIVVKFVEPTSFGVEVEWGPGLTSWENAAELFRATRDHPMVEALEADNRMKDELLTAAVGDYNAALRRARMGERRRNSDNPTPWCYWTPGEFDGALLGFLSKRERDDCQSGGAGPFRRFIRTSPQSKEAKLIADFYRVETKP